MVKVVMDKYINVALEMNFDPFAKVGDDAGKTTNSIICRKMDVIEVVMEKCCSSDQFVTHWPLLALILKRPLLSSVAVKCLYSN